MATINHRQRRHCMFQSWKANFSVLAVSVSLPPQRASFFTTEQWLSHRRKQFCLLEENRMGEIMTITRCSSAPEGAPGCFCICCKQHKLSNHGTLGFSIHTSHICIVIGFESKKDLRDELSRGFKLCLGVPYGHKMWLRLLMVKTSAPNSSNILGKNVKIFCQE
jgi:hypothetical protein